MDKKIEQYLDGHDVTLRLESTSELVAIHSDDERIYVMKESYHALASALLSMNVEDKEQGAISLRLQRWAEDKHSDDVALFDILKDYHIIKKPQ